MKHVHLLRISTFLTNHEYEVQESLPGNLSIFQRVAMACGNALSSISGHPSYYRKSYSQPFVRRYSFMEEASWPDN
jgi:hypothetical protein